MKRKTRQQDKLEEEEKFKVRSDKNMSSINLDSISFL